jgi:hypothetical protein
MFAIDPKMVLNLLNFRELLPKEMLKQMNCC